MIGCIGSFTPPNAKEFSAPAVYLHGHISSRLIKLPKSNQDNELPGTPVCIAATHVDGLVLAFTPFHHSFNYRSAIIHGWANIVTDPAEKLYALEQITNNVVPKRWENAVIPPSDADLKSTGVLRVDIASASAKVRGSGPGVEHVDVQDRERVWSGVVPTWLVYGNPIASQHNEVAEVPEYIRGWTTQENERKEMYARHVAGQIAVKK